MSRYLLFAALAATLSPSALRAQILDEIYDHNSTKPYSSFIELGAIGADFPETGTTFLFAPLWQTQDEMLFTDLRGLYNDLAEVEGNWGLGYRRIINDDTIVGMYGYYDQRYTEYNNRYHQATLGMELLRVENEARINVYIPDDNQEVASARALLINNQIFVQGIYEAAYYGSDLEYGHLLYSNCCRDLEVRGYVGGYFMDRGEGGYESIIGPRTRVEMRMYDLPSLGNGSRLVVGGQYQYDDARDHQGIAYVGIRIALGQGRKLSGLQRRMVNPIVRDVDIITNVGGLGVKDPAKFVSTGTAASNLTVIDANTVDPEIVFTNAGPNSVVYFDGSAGDINTAAGFVFNNGQEAYGGGATVMGCNTGLQATIGTRPTIVGTNIANDVFQLAENNAIAGLNILGGDNGISSMVGGTVYQILDNQVSGADSTGVAVASNLLPGSNVVGNISAGNGGLGFFFNENQGVISDNTASGNMGGGFEFSDNRGQVHNNAAIGNMGDGFFFGDNIVTGSIVGNRSIDNIGDGFEFGTNFITFTDNVANGNAASGFDFDNNSGLFARNTANDNGGSGFSLNFAGGTFTDNSADNNTNHGFRFVEADSNFARNTATNNHANGFDFVINTGGFFENTAADNDGHGFRFEENTWSMRDNVASGNGGDGFNFLENNGMFPIEGNMALNNDGAGFRFINNNGDFIGNTASGNGDYGFLFSINNGNFLNNTSDGNRYGFFFEYNSQTLNGNVATGNTLDGFNFIDNSASSTMSDNTSSGNGGDGFRFEDNNDTFTGNTASDNDGDGFNFVDNDGDMTGNVATGNGLNGFHFNDNLDVFNVNTADDNGGDGFDFMDNQGMMNGNTANGNMFHGFSFVDNFSSFTNNTASGNDGRGFTFSNNQGTFDGNTASMNDLEGIFFDNNHGTFTFNTSNGNRYGFFFQFNTSTMTNNTANGNNFDGFNFVENSFFGTFSDNTANDNSDMGYESINPNSGTAVNNTGSNNTNGGNTYP